jgi:ABC-type transport system involved in multi-copper enzyme maturation permease subunit
MTGLFMKDILIIKKRYHGLLGIVVLAISIGAFFIFPEYAAIYVPLLFPPMGVALLADLATSDEKSGWRKYLPALPLTQKEIVLSRYAFCGLLIAAIFLFSLFYSCLAVLFFEHWTFMEVLIYSFGGLLFAVLMLIVGVPFGYFFKGELATGSMMGVIVLIMILRHTGIISLLLNGSTWIAALMIMAMALILLYCSYRLSLLIYTQKIHLNIRNK